MTALFEGEAGGPAWMFTSKDNALAEQVVGGAAPAGLGFASKGHEVWASMTGRLSSSNDRAVVDRLWNPCVAAWYKGKDHPKLTLLRSDPDHAEVWPNEKSLFAGMELLLGRDPEPDYETKVAEIPIR